MSQEAVAVAAEALKARCGMWDSWQVLAQTALSAAAPHMPVCTCKGGDYDA